MATRSSSRIAALKAKARTDSAIVTSGPDGVATTDESQAPGVNQDQRTTGSRKRNGTKSGTASKSKDPKASAAAKNPPRGSQRSRRFPSTPSRAVQDRQAEAARPGWQPAPERASRTATVAARIRHSARSEDEQPFLVNLGYSHKPFAVYYGSRRGDASDEGQTEEKSERKFLEMLFQAVTTQRQIRRRRAQLEECRNEVRDAHVMITTCRTALANKAPVNQADWAARNFFIGRIAEWEPILKERQGLEKTARHHVDYLESRLKARARCLREYRDLSRGSKALKCLSSSTAFWGSFDLCQKTNDVIDVSPLY